MERPIAASFEDVAEHRLLSNMSYYLDGLTTPQSHECKGVAVVDLLMDMDDAIQVYVLAQSQQGWTILWNAESELRRADWSSVSLVNVIILIHLCAYWATETHDVRC